MIELKIQVWQIWSASDLSKLILNIDILYKQIYILDAYRFDGETALKKEIKRLKRKVKRPRKHDLHGTSLSNARIEHESICLSGIKNIILAEDAIIKFTSHHNIHLYTKKAIQVKYIKKLTTNLNEHFGIFKNLKDPNFTEEDLQQVVMETLIPTIKKISGIMKKGHD